MTNPSLLIFPHKCQTTEAKLEFLMFVEKQTANYNYYLCSALMCTVAPGAYTVR